MTREFDEYLTQMQAIDLDAIEYNAEDTVDVTPESRITKLEHNQWKLRGTVQQLVDLFHMMKRKEPRADLIAKINEL